MSGYCNYYRCSKFQLLSRKAQELGICGAAVAGAAADCRYSDLCCAENFRVQLFAAPSDGTYPSFSCRFMYMDRDKQRYPYKNAKNAHTVSYCYGRF